MDTKKENDSAAKVAFRGVSPFGQTAESSTVPLEQVAAPPREALDDVVRRTRPRKVRDVVHSVLPVLQQVLATAPDVELKQDTATALRLAVAAAAKEVLGKMKK